VQVRGPDGQWRQGNLAQAQQQVKKVAHVETIMEVQRGKQAHPKRQPVEVEIAACPVRLTYSTAVRRKGEGQQADFDAMARAGHCLRHQASPLAFTY
jgi:hypothetical protein